MLNSKYDANIIKTSFKYEFIKNNINISEGIYIYIYN